MEVSDWNMRRLATGAITRFRRAQVPVGAYFYTEGPFRRKDVQRAAAVWDGYATALSDLGFAGTSAGIWMDCRNAIEAAGEEPPWGFANGNTGHNEWLRQCATYLTKEWR